MLKDNKAVPNFNQEELETAIDEQTHKKTKIDLSSIVKPLTKTKMFNFAKGKVWPILVPFFIVMIFLIILPIIAILVYAFVKPTGDTMMFKVTLDNFIKMFSDQNLIISLLLSVAYAFIASLLCIILGYPIALMMAQAKSKIFSKNLWVLITMPIWISMLLKVLGLKSLFLLLAPTYLGTPIAILIGMVYMFIPFAITPIYDSLISRQKDLEEASKDLGCSPLLTFWKITFRFSIPGVFTGFTLVIIQAATSLIVVQYFGNGNTMLVSSIIESYFFKGNDFGLGAAISIVLTIFIFALTIILKVIGNRFERGGKK